jgi:phosphate transport system protein
MAMHRQLDSGMSQLHRLLMRMAGFVEQAIEASTDGWRLPSLARVREVYDIEKLVNQAHLEVDDACVKLLATQSPLAADLRSIIGIIKINSDLERMTDLAVNIANNTEYLLRSAPQYPTTDLSDMADETRMMVREVLNAFVAGDGNAARKVLHRDDRVDAFKRKIVSDTLRQMQTNPAAVEQGMNLIFIAKNLERIGDHATNIAEDIIFMSSGEDIRHSGGEGHGS